MHCLRLPVCFIVVVLFVSVHSRLYNDDYLLRNNGLLGRRPLGRHSGGVSTVTRTETQTQTTNHVLTDPTDAIGGLTGSLTGRSVGGLGLTNQYNDRNQVGLRRGSSSLYNNNVVGGLTDRVVGNNYDTGFN
uniref:Uncharacterized protein n=1 Tax=Magallana gigas TaxID=29159 RepID=K1QMF8_MAGGI